MLANSIQEQDLEPDIKYVSDSVLKSVLEILGVYRRNYSMLVEKLTRVRKSKK
jgi:hypothetical protein